MLKIIGDWGRGGGQFVFGTIKRDYHMCVKVKEKYPLFDAEICFGNSRGVAALLKKNKKLGPPNKNPHTRHN